MKKISPALIGAITGIVMSAIVLIFIEAKLPANSIFQFVVYAIYGVGVISALLLYSKSTGNTAPFVELFGQGFRCFIIVTLILTTFTAVYSWTHPELAENQARLYREYLIEKKQNLPAEIDQMVINGKKQYTTSLIYSSIIRYLFIGAAFAAAAAGAILILRRKK